MLIFYLYVDFINFFNYLFFTNFNFIVFFSDIFNSYFHLLK